MTEKFIPRAEVQPPPPDVVQRAFDDQGRHLPSCARCGHARQAHFLDAQCYGCTLCRSWVGSRGSLPAMEWAAQVFLAVLPECGSPHGQVTESGARLAASVAARQWGSEVKIELACSRAQAAVILARAWEALGVPVELVEEQARTIQRRRETRR